MNYEYDAIVIGARVAGSVTATLLGEYGHRVLLLDRAHFPSDTLSTHFFRSVALKSFRRAGVFDKVSAAAPHMEKTYTDVEGHRWDERVEDDEGINFLMCVRRITLDAILTERVQEVGNVEFLQRARLTGILHENGSVIGATWNDELGRHEATARVLIGADGFYSQVASLVGAETEVHEPVHRAMYFSYFRNLATQAVPGAEHHFRGDHLVYVFLTDDDLTLVAISVPISEFDSYRKNPKEALMSALQTYPMLAPRLKTAEMAAPVKGAGNIPCRMRVPYGSGWALVGDSALVFDPWSGQGIDHAGMHAVMLADELHNWFEKKKTWDEAMSDYHSLRNSSSKKRFESTRKFARDLRPMTRGALKNRGLA